MRPEADVCSYVQGLEKHLQMTLFGGMADPEWAFEGRCGHDLMLPRGRYPHTVRPGSPEPQDQPGGRGLADREVPGDGQPGAARQLRAPGPAIPARQRSASGPTWTAPSGPITAGR